MWQLILYPNGLLLRFPTILGQLQHVNAANCCSFGKNVLVTWKNGKWYAPKFLYSWLISTCKHGKLFTTSKLCNYCWKLLKLLVDLNLWTWNLVLSFKNLNTWTPPNLQLGKWCGASKCFLFWQIATYLIAQICSYKLTVWRYLFSMEHLWGKPCTINNPVFAVQNQLI